MARPGQPVSLTQCYMRICKCGKCAICGYPKHCSLHGGIWAKVGEEMVPDMVYGHEYKPRLTAG